MCCFLLAKFLVFLKFSPIFHFLEYFFKNSNKGILTFPTKFSNIKPILQINYIERLIPRVSLNPDNIITRYELRTSNLQERINAINELCESRI